MASLGADVGGTLRDAVLLDRDELRTAKAPTARRQEDSVLAAAEAMGHADRGRPLELVAVRTAHVTPGPMWLGTQSHTSLTATGVVELEGRRPGSRTAGRTMARRVPGCDASLTTLRTRSCARYQRPGSDRVASLPETDVHISVVIPCLNEEAAIGAVIDQAWIGIGASGMAGEVVVVDNASTDRSAEIAARHGARVISEPRRGYGSAYLAGLAAARGTFIVMADADGSYDLTTIPAFVARLEAGADIVMGSRFRGRIAPGAMPALHRYVGNPLLTGFLNVLFRTGVSDAHCGLRAVRRDVLPTLELQTLGMEFASEMVVKAAKRRLQIAELPIGYAPRVGDSKLNSFRDGWRHLRFLLVHSPTFLFLLPGAILLVAGLAIVLALAAGPIHVLGRTWQIHTMIVGCTAVLVGAQVVQLGLFARTYAILYLDETDAALERAWRHVRLEHGLLLGVLLIAGGVLTLGGVIVHWAKSGFGELSASHPSLFGLMLLGLGVQVFFGSFFLSILGLRKQLLLGERRAAGSGEGTGAAEPRKGQPVGRR